MIATTDTLLSGHNVHPLADREAMLAAVGAETMEDLFSQIPNEIRLHRPLQIQGPLPEWELERKLRGLAAKNASTLTHLSFLGGGGYEQQKPAVTDALSLRGEYLTAYTPYQPEMSQGLLRYLHDFQKVLARLLGLSEVNCSVYDGATALAESAWMTCCAKDRPAIVVVGELWPDYLGVLETYMTGRGVKIHHVAADPGTGATDPAALAALLDIEKVAGVLVQSPNANGVFENIAAFAEVAHQHDALLVAAGDPLAIGLVKSPGACGADIAACEAQSLGLPLNAGGPYLGVVATKPEFKGLLPGRIVGVCDDIKGEEALALISEEREQHVSRDKATSHICSNQAWMALKVLIYLSWLGENGVTRLAALCAQKARYLRGKLCEITGVRPAVSGEFFHEFLLELPVPARPVLKHLEGAGIFGGVPIGENRLLISVTETKSRAMLDQTAAAFANAIQESR